MTHDELLKRIQSDYEENKHFRDQPKWKPFAALRAVVELTQTYKDDSYVNEEFNQGLQTAFSLVIQAIEKELS